MLVLNNNNNNTDTLLCLTLSGTYDNTPQASLFQEEYEEDLVGKVAAVWIVHSEHNLTVQDICCKSCITAGAIVGCKDTKADSWYQHKLTVRGFLGGGDTLTFFLKQAQIWSECCDGDHLLTEC